MKVNAIRCKNCDDLIYSRARHDFRWCSCGTVAIDGGEENMRFCGEHKCFDGPFEFQIDAASYEELYKDWNSMIDKYGRILGKDTPRRRKAIAKKKLLQ